MNSTIGYSSDPGSSLCILCQIFVPSSDVGSVRSVRSGRPHSDLRNKSPTFLLGFTTRASGEKALHRVPPLNLRTIWGSSGIWRSDRTSACSVSVAPDFGGESSVESGQTHRIMLRLKAQLRKAWRMYVS